MKQHEEDTLDTLYSLNKTDKKTYLTERKQIAGTPFTMIRQEDKWFIVMGDYRMTEPTETEDEQIRKLEDEKWWIITCMVSIIIKIQKQLEETMTMLEDYNKTNTDKEADKMTE